MIKFPDELPLGLIATNQLQNVDTNNSVTFASGSNRKRRTFIDAPYNTKFSFVLTWPQFEIFESWFNNECRCGQEWFLIKRKTVRGVEEVSARMTAMYSGPNPIPLAGRWALEFNAELKFDRIDEGIWEFPEVIDNMCLLDRIVNQCWTKAK